MVRNLILICLICIQSVFAQDTSSEVLPVYKDLAQKRIEESEKKPVPENDKTVMREAAEKIAKDLPAPGLKVGDQAPDFEIKNSDGKIIKLSKKLEEGPVVLSFFRGSWCPYCNIEMSVLQRSLPLFKKLNANLITVSPQTEEKSKDLKIKFQGNFDIVSDADYAIAKNYKVYHEMPAELTKLYKEKFFLDLEAFNGVGRTALPVPGTFVISREGKIVAAFCDTDYRKRMEPLEILLALSKLPKKE